MRVKFKCRWASAPYVTQLFCKHLPSVYLPHLPHRLGVSMCSVCTDREGARRTNERAYPQEPFAKGSYETPASSSIKRSAADARAQALLASPAWPWETQNTVNGTQRPTQRRQLWKDRRGHGTVVWWRSSEQRDAHPSNLCMSNKRLFALSTLSACEFKAVNTCEYPVMQSRSDRRINHG